MQKNSTIRVARRGNLGAAASGASKRGHRPGPSARVAGVAASDARARAATREEPPALGPSGPRRPPPQPLTVHPALACGSPSPAEPFPAGPSARHVVFPSPWQPHRLRLPAPGFGLAQAQCERRPALPPLRVRHGAEEAERPLAWVGRGIIVYHVMLLWGMVFSTLSAGTLPRGRESVGRLRSPRF